MSILNSIRRIIALFLVTALSLIVYPNGAKAHTVLDEESCETCITVFSDCHIEGNNFKRFSAFGRMLLDAQNNSFGNDVGVFLGDNTMNGQEIESIFFYGLIKNFGFADNYVNVMGNHDIGNGEGDYEILSRRFYGYSDEFLGIKTDKPYYYRVINGVYFIVLGEEQLSVDENEMSDEQYEFLKETLDMAKADNAVTFICCHHPVFNIIPTENNDLFDIIPQYKNVFFVSGHTHLEIDEDWTFLEYEGIKMLNLPRSTENADTGNVEGSYNCGIGMQIEVYEDEVVARVRDYYTGLWIDGFEMHYPIEK